MKVEMLAKYLRSNSILTMLSLFVGERTGRDVY